MKYDIQFTNQFKKDLKFAKKQNNNNLEERNVKRNWLSIIWYRFRFYVS